MRTKQSDQKTPLRLSKRACRFPTRLGFAALVAAATAVPLHGADVNWDNGSTNFLWNTSSLNWTTAAWNNANGNGAIFGATGVGEIQLPGPINVNSLNFTVDGYTLNGSRAAQLRVRDQHADLRRRQCRHWRIRHDQSDDQQLRRLSEDRRRHAGPQWPRPVRSSATSGSTAATRLKPTCLSAARVGNFDGGFLRLGNANALPTNARVSIGTGYLDIGSNNVTLGELMYVNQVDGATGIPR